MSFRKAPPHAKRAVPAKRCHCEERSDAAIRIPLRHRPYAYFAILPVGRHPCVPPPIPAAPPNGGAHGHRNRDIPSPHGASIFRRLPKKFCFQLSVFSLTDAPPKQQETRSSGFGFQIICVFMCLLLRLIHQQLNGAVAVFDVHHRRAGCVFAVQRPGNVILRFHCDL